MSQKLVFAWPRYPAEQQTEFASDPVHKTVGYKCGQKSENGPVQWLLLCIPACPHSAALPEKTK